MTGTLQLSADEILALMAEQFPTVASVGLTIDVLEPERLVLTWPTTERDLRPGGTVSGPTMMGVVDTALYFILLAHRGRVPLAVTTNLNINFLRKPSPGDLVAEAKPLKLGSRLFVGEVALRIVGSDDIVAHATGTYSIPPPSD